MTKVILITGCLGFIGRHFTSLMIRNGHHVIGVDAETYAADLNFIPRVEDNGKYIRANIAELDHLPDVDIIVNFAAETHVDNSITDSLKFVHTNVLGVQNLLELIRAKRNYEMPHFIQISTDEVYGDIINHADTENNIILPTTEYYPLRPSNPYAASKAAADLLVESYARTYGITYNLIRPSNCYGEGQYPEKLIPKAIRYLRLGKKIPIHGDGNQIRSWLEVCDAARAIECVLDTTFEQNSIFNISGLPIEINEVVRSVIAAYDAVIKTRYLPSHRRTSEFKYDYIAACGLAKEYYEANEETYKSYCQYNYVRPGMDMLYQVSDKRLRKLGWEPINKSFLDQIVHIVIRELQTPIRL